MDAYAHIVRLQVNAKLDGLRREAAEDRLALSLAPRRRPLRQLARRLVRGRAAVAGAKVVLRPVASTAHASEVESPALQKRAS